MNIFKIYIELLKVSHYTRLITSCILISVGAIFGTDGTIEIQSLKEVFDIIMWIGIIPLTIYTVLLIFLSFYNIIGGYQVGSYNKWRDGDFEEWKIKNNIGQGKIDKFIEWFSRGF